MDTNSIEQTSATIHANETYGSVDYVHDIDKAASEADRLALEAVEASERNIAENGHDENPDQNNSPENAEAGASKTEENSEEETEDSSDETENKSEETFAKYHDEWRDSGSLSEDSYKELAEMGIPQYLVDGYIEGLQAQARTDELEAYNSVGGEANYNDMIAWAADNLNDSGVTEFNSMVAKGGRDRERAIKELNEQWVGAVGKQGSLLEGNSAPTSNSDTFKSMDELVAAQRDPRYDTDPAYRRKIYDKLARSSVF